MGGEWERQKREIDSYNTFYAAIKGEVADGGLSDLGFRLVGRFLRVPGSHADVEASPDFVLFDGETLLLIEVKSGENISTRDIEQMESAAAIGVEPAQKYLRETEISAKGHDPAGLSNIQPFIVYYEDFIEECYKSAGCRDSLQDLSTYAAVLSQDKGSRLRLVEGEVDSDGLSSRLEAGIKLLRLPDKNVYLTEGVEEECLAVSICLDLVQNNLGKGRVTITETDVADRYKNRDIPLQKVSQVLEFLDEFGACRRTEDRAYEFTTGHMRNITSIEQALLDKRVDEWLDDGGTQEQSRLTDF